MIFTIKIQKRFADVDMLGHVNNVNLQHYFDLGKSDMFRRLIGGVEDHNSNTSLIIKATHNVYESPVFMAQDTEVTTQIEKIGNTSIVILQTIRDAASGIVNATSHCTMVCFNPQSGESRPVPEHWRAKFEQEIITNNLK